MKALYFREHGELDRLAYGDLSEPTPGPDEVLLRVRACAINHLDLWVLRGWPNLKLPMPHIGGADIAGQIVEAPRGSSFHKGMRVAVTPGFLPLGSSDEWILRGEESLSPAYEIFGESRKGGFAEFVTVPEHTLLEIPEHLSYSEAAAPLLVATTATRMLEERAKVQPGESVLIVGAGGGLNSFSILLAKQLGARVLALTSTPEKMLKAKELGADEVINYRDNPDWNREVKRLTNGRGVDVVVDNVGQSTFPQSLLSARRGGRVVTVGNTSGPQITFDNRLVFTKQLSILGSTMGGRDTAIRAIQRAWNNDVRRLISEEIPLSEGQKAYQRLKEGRQFGKIVLLP